MVQFDILQLVSDTEMESAKLMGGVINDALGELPENILRARQRSLFTFSMIMMADYASLIEAGNAPPVDVATREAASTLTGFLLAPFPG